MADVRAIFDRFSKKYEHAQSDVMREIERTVCGCDYGATSWTTREEARAVADMLALRPDRRLLDVGAGSGWPGVYLAKETGCDIVLTDLPLTGLRSAMKRAAADRIAGSCWAAVAAGSALPFERASFDAIAHSDVLCCLPEKQAVLESCRRVLRPHGKMVFSVISIMPGLSAAEHERAAASGPPFVEADASYPEMLHHSGWTITDHRDLTGAYQESVGRALDKLKSRAEDVAKLFGDEQASDERARRRATLSALESGLLRRELFGAVPAADGRR